MRKQTLDFTRDEILQARGQRNIVPIDTPYGIFTEQERNLEGRIVETAVLLLSNRECPFKCLMCDLWKNTLTSTVPDGAISEQIRQGLEQLPNCESIKLYNAGSFFDPNAIPKRDLPEIACMVKSFETVVVENHPRFCTEDCWTFQELIRPAQLEVAVGLETSDEQVLAALNKQMTLDDFTDSVQRLNTWGIRSRAFILLKPPFHGETEAVEWALKSIDFAFNAGVSSCSIIPTRSGNGIMEQLQNAGHFSPPTGKSIETVMERALESGYSGNVVIDLWDLERFFPCATCKQARVERLRQINLQQRVAEPILCSECREF